MGRKLRYLYDEASCYFWTWGNQAFKKAGFIATRQKGSHVRLEKCDGKKTIKLTVPLHKEMKKGTLKRIIKNAGLTHKEFNNLKEYGCCYFIRQH